MAYNKTFINFCETDIKIEPLSFYGCSSTKQEDHIQDLGNNNHEHRKKSKPQSCKICGKVLSSASSYYVHMKQHSASKPYLCTLCDASFCRKPYLEVHQRTHTGEKPFECDVCKKRFTQKSSLNTHKRVHTGLRPYGCTVCGKKFAVKSYLVAHHWCHVSEVGLFCADCNKFFTSKNQYIQHIKTHSNKAFNCRFCGRSFAKDSYLIRHLDKVHKAPRTRNNLEQRQLADSAI